MMKYKDFTNGLFQMGDIINVTLKPHKGQEPIELIDLVIEDVGKHVMMCIQTIVTVHGQKQQYLRLRTQDVVNIACVWSSRWEEEVQPNILDATPARQRRPRQRSTRPADALFSPDYHHVVATIRSTYRGDEADDSPS